ncbi:PREDICTED: keratinocyte-associated protein 3 [Gekko japonicus]|uniref:Keratinocyte-associated protein 3 n=1 Tax=Gekko japonicus TaxID=146911 RepID=A0ABM1KAB9_GEKJA|nr:PREDICTED: keratinocyte-associated protein 3 [Gekko japonicus]
MGRSGAGLCGFDARHGLQRLMSSGISLVVIGHLNLVLGAIVHGSVLRHVARPNHTITSEYAVANIIAVVSGFLSIATGIVAILVSRNLSHRPLFWVLLVVALANALISGACCVGLAVAISLTVANGGRHLLAGCNSSALPAETHITTNECPFDTTRIYDTALVLWLASLVMAAVEAGLSAWCCAALLSLRGIGPCAASYKVVLVRESSGSPFELQEPTPQKEAAEEGCGGEPHHQLLLEVAKRPS